MRIFLKPPFFAAVYAGRIFGHSVIGQHPQYSTTRAGLSASAKADCKEVSPSGLLPGPPGSHQRYASAYKNTGNVTQMMRGC